MEATAAPPPAAQEVCEHCQLSDQARALLRPEAAIPQFLQALLAAGHLVDAVKFLAQALPKPQAISWACQCLRQLQAAATPPQEQALTACEAWLKEPSDERRRAAFAAAETAGFDNPAACAALAVFFSGGSLAPPNVQAVPPAEYLTGRTVGHAIVLAAVSREPHKAPDKLRHCLSLGRPLLDQVLSRAPSP
ncbi:MAG: hypothetical protein K6T86_12930 [Pirellulales bacterium]|nr:hypothetical protein [Pirellulales bacterium]